jgi:hypothetical protein
LQKSVSLSHEKPRKKVIGAGKKIPPSFNLIDNSEINIQKNLEKSGMQKLVIE